MKINKGYLTLSLIILVGFIVRTIKFGDPAVGTDVSAFATLGKSLIENGSYSYGENYNMGVFFPPGYPVFIGLINLLVDNLFISAKLVSFISSLATIPVFYLLGKELYNEEAGLFAAFAYAVYPLSIILGVYGNSDALFFFFFFLALYIFLQSLKKDSFFISLFLGIIAGLATITRPEGMFLFALPFLQIFGVFGRKPLSIKRDIVKILIILSIAIMIISPYMVFIKSYTGKFVLSGKNNIAVLLAELSHDRSYHEIVSAQKNLYDEAAFSLTDDKTQLTGWNREFRKSLLNDYILKDPMAFAAGYKNKLFLEIKTLVKLFLPFIIPLLILFFDRSLLKQKKLLMFILLPAVYFFMYPVFIIIERQTFFIVLFPLIISSAGFVYSKPVLERLSGRLGIERNGLAVFIKDNIKGIIIAVLIVSSMVYLKYSSFDKVPHPVEHAGAAEYIKMTYQNKYGQYNIMSRKPIVSFFSDSRFTMLPYANSKEVLDFAKLYNVDFIVVDERLLGMWDYYDELLHMDRNFDDIELIYEDRSDKSIKLFKITK